MRGEVWGQLPNGERVQFRPITAADKERLREADSKLSAHSRFERFFTEKRLDDRLLDYLTDIDAVNHVAWGAGLPDEPGEPGIGVGRWVRSKSDPTRAEVALAVLDEYQNQGVGKALLRLLVESGVEHGVREFTAEVLAGNRRVRHLLHQFGGRTVSESEGVAEMVLPLPESSDELSAYPKAEVLV